MYVKNAEKVALTVGVVETVAVSVALPVGLNVPDAVAEGGSVNVGNGV